MSSFTLLCLLLIKRSFSLSPQLKMKGCSKCTALLRLAANANVPLMSLGRVMNLSKSAVSKRITHAKKGSRAPPKVSLAKQVAIRNRRKRVGAALEGLVAKVAPEIKKKLQLKECSRTVQRDLKALGGRTYSMAKGPLTQPGDAAKRLAWSKTQLKDPLYGTTSVFCDEKLFGLSQKGLKIEWVLPQGQRRNRRVGKTLQINVFAAIGPGGRVFVKTVPNMAGTVRHFKYDVARSTRKPGEKRGRKALTIAQKQQKPVLRKGMDAEAFIDVVLDPLRKHMQTRKGCREQVLYLDNARVHTAKSTKRWCEEHGLKLLPLSPRSPDINITENLWANLEARIWRKGTPNSLEQLQKWLDEAVAEVNCKHLYETIRRRTQAVVDIDGKLLNGAWRKSKN